MRIVHKKNSNNIHKYFVITNNTKKEITSTQYEHIKNKKSWKQPGYVVFGRDGCGYTSAARDHLTEKNINFKYYAFHN